MKTLKRSRVHQSLLGKKNIKDKMFPLVLVWVRQRGAWKLYPYNFGTQTLLCYYQFDNTGWIWIHKLLLSSTPQQQSVHTHHHLTPYCHMTLANSLPTVSPTHVIPSLQHRISQYRFPYGLYILPAHTCFFLTKDLLRYESCTYPIKFPW